MDYVMGGLPVWAFALAFLVAGFAGFVKGAIGFAFPLIMIAVSLLEERKFPQPVRVNAINMSRTSLFIAVVLAVLLTLLGVRVCRFPFLGLATIQSLRASSRFRQAPCPMPT